MFDFLFKKTEPQPLFFSTDIHCHILPGIDDGSPDVDTSVNLIERMQKWGLKRIFASPHVTFGTYANDLGTVTPALESLTGALTAKGNDLQLSHWAEYRIDELLAERLKDPQTMMTMPGGRLLIENSFFQEPWNLEQLVFDLQVKGYRPILAHPERYAYYYNNRSRYRALHDAGLAFQVNVLSLAGNYGHAEKKMAEYLIEQGYVDYLGTDLHRASHADCIDRYLSSRDYLKHRRALEASLKNDAI